MSILEEIRKEIEDTLDNKYNDLMGNFKKEINKIKPKNVKVYLEKLKTSEHKDHYHDKFDIVLKTVHAAIPVFLTGDAGSGKTTLAEQVARALDLNITAYQYVFKPLKPHS